MKTSSFVSNNLIRKLKKKMIHQFGLASLLIFQLVNVLFLIGTMMETPVTFQITSTAVEPTSILTLLLRRTTNRLMMYLNILIHLNVFISFLLFYNDLYIKFIYVLYFFYQLYVLFRFVLVWNAYIFFY